MLTAAWIIQMIATGVLAAICFETGSPTLGAVNAGLCAVGLVGLIMSVRPS